MRRYDLSRTRTCDNCGWVDTWDIDKGEYTKHHCYADEEERGGKPCVLCGRSRRGCGFMPKEGYPLGKKHG